MGLILICIWLVLLFGHGYEMKARDGLIFSLYYDDDNDDYE